MKKNKIKCTLNGLHLQQQQIISVRIAKKNHHLG